MVLDVEMEVEASSVDPILACETRAPQDKEEATMVRRRDPWFCIIIGELYEKSHSHPLLKCVSDVDYVMREIHLGICGNHIGGHTLSSKALRARYIARLWKRKPSNS